MEHLLRRLTEAYGPSGREDEVSSIIDHELRNCCDTSSTDALGNLIVTRGRSGARLMLAAHMDEIGVVVSHIDEQGFLRFAPVGGVFPITLVGHRVKFADGLIGAVGIEPRTSSKDEVKLEHLYIDVGAEGKEDALKRVAVGDFATFWRDFTPVGGRWIAKAMDDRAGCAVLIEALRSCKDLANDTVCVFTAQEEIGPRGATTSAYALAPQVAVAVDVTRTGDTPEARHMSVSLGKGPAIKVMDQGMLTHPMVRRHLIEIAERNGIPYQIEVLEDGTTDAQSIQTAREGVPTGVISIPTRYVHTPSEMVDPSDLLNTVKLLVEVLKTPWAQVLQ